MRASGLVALVFIASNGFGGQLAEGDRLRGLLDAVTPLPMTRVEVRADSTPQLVGISAVAADELGNLYVIRRPETGDPVVVLDPTGRLLRSWGEGLFENPHGIRLDAAGNVWTVDSVSSVVYEFAASGELIQKIDVDEIPNTPHRGESPGPCGAADVAFGGDGILYVADGYCNGRVLVFDAEGRKLREWGDHGDGPGEFTVVHSIAVGPHGNIYVADRENGRLQWFDPQGKLLGHWTYGGLLHSVAFSPAGDLFVSLRPERGPDEASVVHSSTRRPARCSAALTSWRTSWRSHPMGLSCQPRAARISCCTARRSERPHPAECREEGAVTRWKS